jgi:DNA-binding protein HU-beta
LNKSDIIELVSIRTGVAKKKVELIINLFIDKITDEVHKGNDVELRGFGTFYQITQEKRKIKSPIAGKTIDVPAKNKIGFKASKNTNKEID